VNVDLDEILHFHIFSKCKHFLWTIQRH